MMKMNALQVIPSNEFGSNHPKMTANGVYMTHSLGARTVSLRDLAHAFTHAHRQAPFVDDSMPENVKCQPATSTRSTTTLPLAKTLSKTNVE